MQNAFWNAGDEFFSSSGWEHAAGGGEGITLGGGGGDDGGSYRIFGEAESGLGIDDVGVGNAVDLDALLQIT